jgi:SHS2 domain-containing protein
LQPRPAAGGPAAQPASRRRSVALAAPDRTALLIDFLNAVLLSAQTHRESYPRVDFRRLTDRELAAELEGTPVEAFGEDVKAVTYHEADLRPGAEGSWSTVVVFDI